jgi:sRNA-binding protein
MAKEGNTYAKKARETLKRQKAEAKRERRQKRKELPETGNSGSPDPRANEVESHAPQQSLSVRLGSSET